MSDEVTTTAGVIVVGAGLCGLTVATLLEQAGMSVAVLEAAGEVGGRTRSRWVGGRRLDVGGELVGTDCHQLRRLISGLGLHLDTGPLHFGGADRSSWPGTMEGAVLDGQRLAAELLCESSTSKPSIRQVE